MAKNLKDTAIVDERDAAGTEIAPKMGGAAAPSRETSKTKVANRDPGPRKTGATPRPTDKPIVGGDRD